MFQNISRLYLKSYKRNIPTRWFHISYRLSNDIPSTFHPEKYEEFKDKGLIDAKILQSLRRNNFINLTPIQKQALGPIINTEKGIVCRAKTGTGKTLTFIIPTLNEILKKSKSKHVDTLIIVPTRDLAFQIYDEYRKIIDKLPGNNPRQKPSIGMVIGGSQNIFNPRFPPEIVVATPGRLEANLTSKKDFARCFNNVTYRVFDEADRLLDIGFEPSLNKINDLLYENRVNPDPIKSLLFSATVDDKISNFSRNNIGQDYTFINTVSDSEPEVHENVKQTLVKCDTQTDKLNTLFNYLFNTMKEQDKFKIMIFAPTKSGVQWLTDYIEQIKNSELNVHSDFELLQLAGNLTAGARTRNLSRFKRSNKGVLITTDVAARGIDVKGVTHVFQPFASPEVADYVHKVGRTGRAGLKGDAILFLGDAETRFANLLKRQRGVEFAELVESQNLEHQIDFIGNVKASPILTEDYIVRFFGYITQLKPLRVIDIDQIIQETCEMYRTIMQDPSLRVSQGVLNHIGDVSSRLRREYFTGGFRNYNNNRQRRDQDDFNSRGTFYKKSRDFRSDFRGSSRADSKSDFRGGSRADKRFRF
ncbi:unnamed protein product [Candida verbasci]|uniref:ATP-dependent RNA helicase n=1 Tax=Candida verbasci TaxID=1227364 RepID=A0A9W4XFR4_9ASCO|nr:unnamed protein product [Candida verbasci]